MVRREFPQAFQLVAGTKRPLVTWSDPATCGPTETFGEARYGLPTGPRNGIWVLDLDVKNGKNGCQTIQAAATLPDTYTVLTPSGGYHLYFKWDDKQPVGNPVGILDGVDVRGDGGYVCAGGDYRPVNDCDIVAAPDWLIALVCSRQDDGPPGESAVAIGPDHPEWENRIAQARKFIDGEPPCVSGQGGQAQIWKMSLRLMRTLELPVDTAVGLLQERYNTLCLPPWSVAELRRHLTNAAEHGTGPTGTFTGSFLAGLGQQPGKVPAPVEVGEWRQRPNPNHQYTADLAALCAGAIQKSYSLDPKALGGTFTGPGAMPPWTGVWQYDIFRRRVVAVNPPFSLDAENAGLSIKDLAKIQTWVSCSGGKVTIDQLEKAILVAADQASFHPVRDYLGALPVTEKSAADAYFTGIAGRLWGADEQRNELESGHLRRIAIAAVRRIKVPGTKVDTMLVLAGPQGFRKSLMCAKLFGEYFLDQVPPIQSGRGHEASIAIEGRWGIEVAEMNALASAGESAKKEFLTRCIDKYRPVFGKAVQEVPRQCVFIGTTNDDDFLSDPTGDTRYNVCDIRNVINLELLDRDAFWSAAVALEAAGEPHFRDRAELASRKSAGHGQIFGNGGILPSVMPEGAAFASEDAWTDEILEHATKAASASDAGGFVTASHVAKAIGLTLEKRDKVAQNRVKSVLRRTYGASQVQWLNGRAQRCYKVTP
jgi:hypothetical protein